MFHVTPAIVAGRRWNEKFMPPPVGPSIPDHRPVSSKHPAGHAALIKIGNINIDLSASSAYGSYQYFGHKISE